MKELNWPSKFFVAVILISILFKIEFFPISNYQMYSETLLPKPTFIYHRLLEVNSTGVEVPFRNSEYGIFPLEEPLIQSIETNEAAGKSLAKITLGLFAKAKLKNPQLKELRLYRMEFNWPLYKELRLSGDLEARGAVKMVLLETAHD